jgi:NitT/TauT family transport system permease protein
MNRNGSAKIPIIFAPLVVLGVLLVLWDVAVRVLNIPSYIMPTPVAVFEAASAHSGDLLRSMLITAMAAVSGFILSLAAGSVISFLFAQASWIRRSFYPYAIFLQTVPIVAIAPLIIIWFGFGFISVVVISFILSLFPIVTNITTGLITLDSSHRDLFAVHHATRQQVLLKLRLPNSVPYLVTGARISCGLSVIGAIVGEFMAGFGSGQQGLGHLIQVTSGLSRMDYLFAAIIASAVLGLVIFMSVSLAGKWLLNRFQIVEQ